MGEAVVVGVIGVLVGLLVCLRGYVAFRVIVTLLGAWFGLLLAGGIAANLTGEPMFSSVATWVAAIVGALVLGALAYAVYQAAVIIGMGALGYGLATTVAVTAGVESAVTVQVIGVVAAVLLAVVALATNLPAIIVIVLTALAGANITLTGVLLLLQTTDLADLEAGRATDGPAWAGIATLVLAVVGVVVQYRGSRRDPDRRMRSAWAGRAAA